MQTRSVWKRVTNLGNNMAFRDKDLSPANSLWDSAPLLAAMDPGVAFKLFEDFLAIPCDDTTSLPTGWKVVKDAACSITLPAGLGGNLLIATDGVDNEEAYMQLGPLATEAPFGITSASAKPLWFEIKAKALQHADMGVFIGLAKAAAAAANFLTDNTGVPADKDYIGFRIKTDASAEWDVAWKKTGQAEQEVANVVANADNFHFFGFHFDGTNTITFYVDRVAVSTVALANAATFPGGVALAPICALKTGEAVIKSIDIDYLMVVQVR